MPFKDDADKNPKWIHLTSWPIRAKSIELKKYMILHTGFMLTNIMLFFFEHFKIVRK